MERSVEASRGRALRGQVFGDRVCRLVRGGNVREIEGLVPQGRAGILGERRVLVVEVADGEMDILGRLHRTARNHKVLRRKVMEAAQGSVDLVVVRTAANDRWVVLTP